MKLKHENYDSTTLNRFDLLGDSEVGLAKSFAYLISCERNILYSFLRGIGITAHNTEANYREATIEIEKYRDEGRTDIEIRQKNKFHVIVECKIGKNWVGKQRTQYLSAFNNSIKEKQRVMCFITQQEDWYLERKDENVAICYREWSDILDLINDKEFNRSELVKEFVGYVTKGFNMRTQREILIQDTAGDKGKGGINRFEEYRIYTNKHKPIAPQYFAPYYTKGSKHNDGAGISYLSKVLGVLSIKPEEFSSYMDELNNYASYANDSKAILDNWCRGLENSDMPKVKKSFYLLDEPIRLSKPLLKAERSEATGWIGDQIPPNRCVTFEEFIRRIIAGG